ncbi:hypothetical protein BGZ73_006962 [Actinomortierella ambigua]|nr:hypothetical protein BGZ73_006962 [Actinomortierella ambigua]
MFKDILADLVGEGGIVTADGAHWKFQRKLASHIFTIQAFREYTSKVFVVHGKKVIEILGKAADQGSVVEFQSLMLSFTLDCLGEIAFGKDFGCLEDIDNPPPFAASFDYLLANCSRRILNPMWKFTDRWNGVSQEVEYHRNLIRGYALDIIDKRKKEADSSRKVDLLQLFMDGHDEKGLPLSEDLVIDNILTFMVAGRETTACSLTWMLYLLYRDDTDRHVAETLVQEVDDVLKGLDPSYETYKKQKYAEACFNEGNSPRSNTLS